MAEGKEETNSEEINEKLKKGKGTVDVVQEAMGSFGPWQIVIAVALSLVNFPVAWHQLSIVFLAPPLNYKKCIDPLAKNFTLSGDDCLIILDDNSTLKCSQFEYDRSIFKETIITQWDLVCDKENYANIVQSFTQLGILIGNLIFGAMSDRIGRKIPLMIAILLQSVTGLITIFSPWYFFFLTFKFIAAIATGGTMLVSFVLLMEIVGPKTRSPLSVLFHVPFLLGFLLNPLISYLTRTWYGFQMSVSIPPIFLLFYYWIVPESPRWLLAVGRTKEAEEILLEATKKNHIPLGNVAAAIEHHNSQSNRKTQEAQENQYNITHLMRTPNLRRKTICICVNWFVCGICFFGLVQYVGTLEGNIFINTVISAAVQLPGTLIVWYLISRVSRLRLLMSGNILSGVSLLLIMFADNYPNVKVTLATLGLVGMSISFPTMYLYSSEVFPTVVRNVGIGAGSICARIASMVAPYFATMTNVEPWLQPLFFGIGPLIGAMLCLLLPETMNCDLPETIEDGENFGKKKSSLKIFRRLEQLRKRSQTEG